MLVLALFIFAACGNPIETENKTESVQGIEYAKHFSLIHKQDFVELIILNPENNQAEKKYALVQRGSKPTVPAD